MGIIGKLLGTEDPVKEAGPIVKKINQLESEFERFSREELVEKTRQWKKQISDLSSPLPQSLPQGEGNKNRFLPPGGGGEEGGREVEKYLNSILPEAFAVVREAAKRTLQQRHYDVQLVGGLVLHQGRIAEMKTGEGKTLAATLPVYLNALTGRGVHIVTVNDYLARRDASWMGQIYDYLGLTVGAIQHEQSYLYSSSPASGTLSSQGGEGRGEEAPQVQIDVKNLVACSRKEAYQAHVLYGTNNEFGFDYLRDNMVRGSEQMVQPELNYAIIDEVDSILIDEARTPLIISAPDMESTDLYREFAGFAKTLEQDDFVLEEKHRQVNYTEKGYEKLEKKYGSEIYSDIKLRHHADTALRAQTLFKKDKDYVVRPSPLSKGEGEIIIVDEFTGRLMLGRRYSEGLHQAIEARENVPVKQESKTLATITFQNYFRLYRKLGGMTGTAATEAEEFHKIYNLDVVEIPTNEPMIRADLPDSVYKNEPGKFEAIVREIKRRNTAGQPVLIGTISIEKNEFLSALLKKAGIKHEVLNAKNHEREAHIIAQAGSLQAVTLATNIAGRGVDIILGGNPPDNTEAQKVKELGGLHILGTERHEARRIDNQLRGRSGRQGDPGSSQFFLSLEDDLMRIFGGERIKGLMDTLKVPPDQPIEHSLVSKSIEAAQKKIEGFNFDLRKHVLEYDDVLNKQRGVIYGRRRKILKGEANLKEQILDKVAEELKAIVALENNPAKIRGAVNAIFQVARENWKEFREEAMWITYLTDLARQSYEAKEEEISTSNMREIEKLLTLQALDNFWMEHLDTMDHLRQSVRLRGYAQRDPLVEYKKDGMRLFERMLKEIDRTIVYTIFKVEVRPREEIQTATRAPSSVKTSEGKKVGRNDPCWCGAVNPNTGKVYKYKHCGLINAPHHKK